MNILLNIIISTDNRNTNQRSVIRAGHGAFLEVGRYISVYEYLKNHALPLIIL